MSFELTIEPIGETIEVEEGQTVLDACLRQGVWLPHACGHGLCGTCKVDVLEGDFDHGDASSFALMDFERDEGKALACTCTMNEDMVIEADVEEDDDALYLPVRDYTGTVAAVADLTPDIKGITLELDGEGIEFQAGQYINLTVPGVDGARAFSIASSPAEHNRIELHVRLVPGGKATTWIHNELQVGETLQFAGPYGQFFVRKSQNLPKIFIAGGSGLSSPKSMILDLLEEGCGTPIWLFHGARGVRDLYYRELFENLAAENDNFTYVPALSEQADGGDWSGETGFVHEAVERIFDGRFEGNSAYLCGPPPMIEAAIRTLMKGRLFEEGIFTEKFLTAGDENKVKSPVFKRI